MARPWSRLVAGFLDLLFPGSRVCLLCGETLPEGNEHLCPRCIEALPSLEGPLCPRCSAVLPYPGALCQDCAMVDPPFAAATALGPYHGAWRELVKELKFGNRPDLADILGTLMASRLPAWPVEVVVPVPLSTARLQQRGYNQAELLAKAVADARHWPLVPALARRHAAPQARLGRAQRLQNLRDAYTCRRPELVQGRTVLLVDDVITTGATAAAASQALLAAGAAAVYVTAIAR